MSLRERHDIHLARRLWHFGGVSIIVLLLAVLHRPTAVATALAGTAFVLAIDVSRHLVPLVHRWSLRLLQPFMRESERHGAAGVSFMMVGVSFVILVFPRPVAILCLLLFSVADPLASYFGVLYGRDKIVGQKSFQGALAAFASGVVVAALYFYFADLMRERLFIVAWLTGLITAASELMPVGRLDDNFVFPIMSATLLTGLFYVFGGF